MFETRYVTSGRRQRRITGTAVALVAGVVLAVVGATLSVLWTNIFDLIVRKELTLSPQSASYEMWKATPVPITLEFYLFNWTNPEEIRVQDRRPVLDQLGPYVFNEVHEKVNVTWNSNGTVSFKQVRRWFFDEERSNGSLDDSVTTLNVIAITAAFVARDWGYLMQKSLSVGLSSMRQTLSVTHSVGELLFDGYSSPLITMGKALPALASVEIPFDKFGWFYMRNGSADYDGLFTMHTGVDDVSLLGSLSRWNGAARTEFFSGPCGMVNGSAGEFWPPRRSKEDTVAMFSPDLCRSMEFPFDRETEVEGILGYQYSGGGDLLDNRTDCFCGGECVPSGVLNVSTCRFGAPAFVSYPHFYLADPVYLQQVEGLSPEPELHRFYITLEPETGIPLDVAARFQINILLQPHRYISLLHGVPRIFFPMLWFQERAAMTAELSGQLRQLLMVPTAGRASSLLLLAAGILIVILASVFTLRRRTQHSNSAMLLEPVKSVTPVSLVLQ